MIGKQESRNLRKRSIALLLACVLILSCFVTAWASEDDDYAGDNSEDTTESTRESEPEDRTEDPGTEPSNQETGGEEPGGEEPGGQESGSSEEEGSELETPETEEPGEEPDEETEEESGAEQDGGETGGNQSTEGGSGSSEGEEDAATDSEADGETDSSDSEKTDEDDQEEPEVFTGIRAADITVQWGDETFTLLDGVEARDSENNQIDEILVANDGGFDVLVAGSYQVIYEAADPLTEEVYTAERTVTVEAGPMMMAAFGLPVGNYLDLQDKINTAPAGVETEIEVTASFKMDNTLKIPAGKEIVLTSATASPETLTVTGHLKFHVEVEPNAKLTVKNLSLLYDEDEPDNGGIENKGTLILEDGATVQGIYYAGVRNNTGATLIMNGGTAQNSKIGVDNSGYFEFYSGLITGSRSHGVLNASGATVNKREECEYFLYTNRLHIA